MNFFHGGRLAGMPAKLLNDVGDLFLLRPLAYCAEDDLARFAAAMRFPIIPCDLCGSQDGLQRNAMKALLADIETRMRSEERRGGKEGFITGSIRGWTAP